MTHSVDPDVLSAYFATMRQFLATQSRVMSSFLGGMPAGMELPALPPATPAEAGVLVAVADEGAVARAWYARIVHHAPPEADIRAPPCHAVERGTTSPGSDGPVRAPAPQPAVSGS